MTYQEDDMVNKTQAARQLTQRELRAQRSQLYDTLHKAVKQRDKAEADNERLRARVAILEAELRVAYQLPNAIDRAFEQEPER